MNPCIVVVKGKVKIQFHHQFLYTGREDEARCHFCQQSVPSKKEYEAQLQAEAEDYPGQKYFHAHNPNIKAADEAARKRKIVLDN